MHETTCDRRRNAGFEAPWGTKTPGRRDRRGPLLPAASRLRSCLRARRTRPVTAHAQARWRESADGPAPRTTSTTLLPRSARAVLGTARRRIRRTTEISTCRAGRCAHALGQPARDRIRARDGSTERAKPSPSLARQRTRCATREAKHEIVVTAPKGALPRRTSVLGKAHRNGYFSRASLARCSR